MNAAVTVFDCKWASWARPCQEMCVGVTGLFSPQSCWPAACHADSSVPASSKGAVHTACLGNLGQVGEREETFL